MTFLIAAAGTGGHVFPGLAVGEGLIDLGVDQSAICFVGGDRLESRVYPDQGFEFLQVRLAGLKRSMSLQNLKLPMVVRRARDRILSHISDTNTEAVLGMGGYVTVPAALAAHKAGVPLFVAEQNAGAGLANRIAARWAIEKFVSFPETKGLEGGLWAGNPVRRRFREYDKTGLGSLGFDEFGLRPGIPTLGVFGGSLGALAINAAVTSMLTSWDGPPMQVLHLTGESHAERVGAIDAPADVVWRRVGFTERMDLFFSACDVVVARAGGGLAEITATGTPAILIPGEFGSSGHQRENAAFLGKAGAARVLEEDRLDKLGAEVGRLLFDPEVLKDMATASREIARPDAALTIARAMIESRS